MAYRVLIVPGDNQALRALQDQLADDVDVHVLDTANDALWEVRNAPPDVIIADVQLPGMSGLDLAEILPNFGVPTKVVLWSREPNQQAAAQAADHGVHRFLSGAVSPEELQKAVYEAMGRADIGPTGSASPTPASPAPLPATPPTPQPMSKAEPPAARAPEQPRQERPAPAPAPAAAPPAPARKPAARRGGPLVLTADALRPIRSRMDALVQDVGAQCILLTDRAGMVLAEVGHTSGLPTMILLPLLSTSFSTASQISQMLHEEESTALYMHEGSRYDLYCFDVLQRFMFVIVFDKGGPVAKIGSVWVYAKRAIRDIQELLA
jgi:DNA-binding NarL/FixJ family response regulator